jgi:hypothetical protein
MNSFSGSRPKRYSKNLQSNPKIFEDLTFSLSKYLSNDRKLESFRPTLPMTTKITRMSGKIDAKVKLTNQVSKGTLIDSPSNKAKTALSHSFNHFESKESNRLYSKKNYSVISNTIRPSFLEPEVISTYVPTKSYFLSKFPNQRYSGLHDSYQFPVLRNKYREDSYLTTRNNYSFN